MIGSSDNRGKKSRWLAAQAMLLCGSGIAALLSFLSWQMGAMGSHVDMQVDLLLYLLLALNLAPAFAELACHRFDPFDAKHLFLAYFFLIFSLSAFWEIKFGFVRLGLLPQGLEATTRIRALAAIVLGLCMFIIGCYLPVGAMLAAVLPNLKGFLPVRVKLVAFTGIASGVVAFYYLMDSSGGISNFLNDIGSWRTLGVLAGVGYLTFPISAVLPASVLLLLLLTLPPASRRLPWSLTVVLLLAASSLVPILVLGFRITLVPIIFQFLIVWHYQRRRLRLRWLLAIGAVLVMGLVIFANLRSQEAPLSKGGLDDALLFRTPGLATVERVVQRMDQGEPYRGVSAVVIEATTILVPRAIWPNKPQTAGITFDDIFFYDFFIGRGDPIDGLKSGVSSTSIGEALWTRGIALVILGALSLGIIARTATSWHAKGLGYRLHTFFYALFVSNLPIFVEAPQNALNSFVMIGAMSVLMAAAINS